MQHTRRYDQTGHGLLVMLVVAVVLLVVGFTAWRYVAAGKPPKAAEISVTDYESCTRSPDRTIVKSRPEQCVTKDGRAFTNK